MTDTVGFSVGTVARRLGVAPSTLRTWNRRYGIGAGELSPGKHRRYTAEDIIRLEHMQKLILRGAAPADAARAALAAPVVLVPAQAGPDSDGAGMATGTAGGGAGGRELDGLADEELPAARSGPGHGSGGQRLALPGASPEARGLARAALALDGKRISEGIRAALARDGSVRTWEDLVVPVLSELGARSRHSDTCIAAEHLLSVAAIAEFSRHTADLPGQVQHRAVLLASAEGERHSLPLHALAAGLAERGIESRILGPDLPYHALAAAVQRSGPGVVFLWSQVPATGDPAMLPDLFPRRPGARLILGGLGWDRDRIPASARLVDTLPGALTEVAAALGY